ncbi:MAG: hypothetical protein NTU53_12395, partial [Planctomycetota bacterium]|nr:hypothetical protein [Planctomycetota bacterium]
MSRRTSNLRIGKTEARKSEPVKPVAEGHIEATLAHVSPQVKSMIELQLITGMRPGEVCAMRTCDIDSTGPLWTYRPSHSSLARSFTPPRTLHFGNRARRRFAPSMGETLTIAAVEKPVVSKLVIKKAVYGDLPDGAKTDVTEKVAAMVKDG